MKKLIFLLILTLCIVLTSCSTKPEVPIIEEPIILINQSTVNNSAINESASAINLTEITPEERIIKANQNGILLVMDSYNWTQTDVDRGMLNTINITITNEDSNEFTPEIVVILYEGQINPEDRATKSIKLNDIKLKKGDSITKELKVDLPFSKIKVEQNLRILVYDAFSLPKQLLVELEKIVVFG